MPRTQAEPTETPPPVPTPAVAPLPAGHGGVYAINEAGERVLVEFPTADPQPAAGMQTE